MKARRQKGTHKLISINADPALEGTKVCYKMESATRIVYLVSPAILTLLHDDEVAEQVMKDLRVVPLSNIVEEIFDEM